MAESPNGRPKATVPAADKQPQPRMDRRKRMRRVIWGTVLGAVVVIGLMIPFFFQT